MNNPTISIIIPVANQANHRLLEKSLNSLLTQTAKPLEVLTVIDPNADSRLFSTIMKYPFIRILQRQLSKSQARNYGASKAKGKYLLHVDIDYVLPKSLLNKSIKLIVKNRSKAIILHETINPAKTIWQKARKLEREIQLNDLDLAAPQLIEKKLFNKIGGFDNRIDLLDDWVLMIKLKKESVMVDRIISPLIAVHEPTSVCQIIKHRYQKGRYLKLYKKIYGQVPQVNVTKRLEVYRENFDKIIRNPVVFGALLLLKFFDLAAFYFGSLFPIADRSKSGADNYKDRLIAEAFDKQQLSPYARLKHHWEARALLSTLKKDQPKSKILELGAGTGRITKILINQGYRVTPVDISKTMIKEYLKKTGLPKPILIKKGRLPFSNNSFDTVVATRVIWHITDKKEWEKFFHEAVRVTKKDILMDFAMVKRGLNSFFSHDYFFTMQEIKTLAKANKLKITSIKWLPLGRLLIKFSHAS